MPTMRFERAVDLIARLALSYGEPEDQIRSILYPIGERNIQLVMERMAEIRQDLRPRNEVKDQAWDLLRSRQS